MKKFFAILLAIILIFSTVCMSGCSLIGDFFEGLFGNGVGSPSDGDGSDGGNGGGHGMAGGNNGNSYGDDGHKHQFESYFVYSECTVDGCDVVGRNQSEMTYADDFVYTLTEDKVAEIGVLYDEMVSYLSDDGDFDYFETLYDEYLDLYDYAIHQYQVSSILSDVEYSTTTANNYRMASKLYNEMRANYYGIFAIAYNSNWRDLFYEGWDDDEIARALNYADMYAGSADNNNVVDEILAEYDDYMNSIDRYVSSSDLPYIGELYGRLVEANNNVAQAAHYNNYMDYAYEHEYNRNYTPRLVSDTMRAYVKEYVAPIFIDLAFKNNAYYYSNFNSELDKDFYYALSSQSLFADQTNDNFARTQMAVELISDYFSYLNRPSATTGGKDVNFKLAVEDLLQKGNYFLGDYNGAYTWWISEISHPILYFGPNYDTAFTFVHEFGHYYNNIYNGSMSLSYDHDETHSQGDEMLFLAWLANHKPKGVTNGYSIVEVEQLYDMLVNIVIATAVDEFEQAAYTGIYNGQPIDFDQYSYADLFVQILGSYKGTYKGNSISALAFLNSKYWAYVVFNSSAYYISYAMSALPSIELYVKARQEGMYDGRDSYVKLFTFSNDSRFATVSSSGKKSLTPDATYEAILNFSGLQGPFQEGLYTSLKNYFDSRTDLKN